MVCVSSALSSSTVQEWDRQRIGSFQGCGFPEYSEVKSTRREGRMDAKEGFCDAPGNCSWVRKEGEASGKEVAPQRYRNG